MPARPEPCSPAFRSRRRRTAAAAACCAAAALQVTTGGARAQSAPAAAGESPTDQITVTGTRVRGAHPVGAPVTQIQREDMDATGLSTTTDIVRTLPVALSIGTDESALRAQAQTGNLNVGYGSGINLRALGPSSTLTLFNGRRIAPSGQRGQQFETSTIPPAALQRVEVVADGASAIYGSDAVGGVVNLILRKNLEGLEARARFGRSDGGIDQSNVSLAAGHGWSSGSVMVAYDYYRRDKLFASQRPEFFNDDQRAYAGGIDNRSNNSAAGNVLVGTTYYPIQHAGGVNTLGPATTQAGANKQSVYLGTTVLPQQERNSIVMSATQELTSRIDLFADGFYSHRRFYQLNAAQAYAAAVPSSNPFFLRPTGSTATSVNVNYSFINDLGPTVLDGGLRTDMLAAGANIDLGAQWKAEVYWTQSHSNDDRYADSINTCAVSNPGAGQAGARAVCGATVGTLYDTNPATSLNVFGGGGNNNPATLAKIKGRTLFHGEYRLDGVVAKADGPVLTLPGGKLRMAVGAEHYNHHQRNLNPTTAGSSDVDTVLTPQSQPQQRTVKAAFAEALVPVVGAGNAGTALRALDLSAAVRYEHYSDFGATTKPKLSFNYVPLDGLAAHGSYGKSFRAPTLADSNPDSTVGINTAQYREANGTTLTQGLGLVGGNPKLGPETARTWSAGLDFRPSFVPGLYLSANYFNVDYRNRIGTPALDLGNSFLQEGLYSAYIVRRPANAATVFNSGFCAGKIFNDCVAEQLARPFSTATTNDPNSYQFIVDGRSQNAGTLKTSGVDLRAEYRTATPWGNGNAGVSATRISKFVVATVVGGPEIERVNSVDYPLRWKSRFDFGWQYAGLRGDAFVNYNNRYDNRTVSPQQSVAAYTTVDASISYSTGNAPGIGALRNLSLQLSAINLFDRDPPFALVGNQLFDSLTGSALKRTVALQLTKAW